MYHFLFTSYQQWCSCQSEEYILNNGEQFVDQVHRMMGYDKVIVRTFLASQPWFISKLELL